jgi:hypothetical protein
MANVHAVGTSHSRNRPAAVSNNLQQLDQVDKTTMLHKTAQEPYEKLNKVFVRLMERFNRDDLDDFIHTANSLREWIRQDGNLNQEQKAALERFVVNGSVDWQICNQLANFQKHVGAQPRSKA